MITKLSVHVIHFNHWQTSQWHVNNYLLYPNLILKPFLETRLGDMSVTNFLFLFTWKHVCISQKTYPFYSWLCDSKCLFDIHLYNIYFFLLVFRYAPELCFVFRNIYTVVYLNGKSNNISLTTVSNIHVHVYVYFSCPTWS